jgi:hypothetical protein
MLLVLITAVLFGPGIDAPIVPAQPTIRSEIRRGMDAARDCHRFNAVTEMESYTDCIDAARRHNRQQMATGFEAFDVGLYRAARDEMRIVLDVLNQSPSPLFDPVSAKLRLDVEQSGYDAARAALSLSDDQVDSAAH